MLDILKRTYCGRSASSSCTSPIPARRLDAGAHRRRGQGNQFTPRRQARDPQEADRGEGFEKFLHKRYTGTKRFGLDGGEALIPALEQIIKRGGALGVEGNRLGMAHRGRLNVLAAVMGKPHRAIFHEFQGGNSRRTTSKARAT
jgi:2-oxoglutarate dehydrogenase E1 component